MSIDERKQAIIRILSERNEISLSELGEELHYAPATLRRTVATLEESGLLRRTHGRIHRIDTISNAVPALPVRSAANSDAKRRIARRAAQLVSNRSTIILDSGSTTGMLGEELMDKELNVFTNSLEIAHAMAPSHSTVVCCGGIVSPEHLCVLGPDAERYFQRIEADMMFLAGSGVRGSQGMTTSSPLQYNIKQAMLKAARKRIALFDLTKLSVARLFLFADFSEIDVIVTERPIPGSAEEQQLSDISARGPELVFADDE